MTWVALVGPQSEDNQPLRYLAGSLAQAGYRSAILAFESALAAILQASERPAVVGLSLDSPAQAQLALSCALALRQQGYTGHVVAGGRVATARCTELLREFAALDSVVRQEAAHGLVALVSAVACNRPLHDVPGLAFRSGGDVVLTPLSELTRPDPGTPRAVAPLTGGDGYARLRDPDVLAAEMLELQRSRGVEIFVFGADTFFPDSQRKNLERLHALADALERRGIGRFATVIRARSTDVERELFQVLRDRLQAIRVDLDVENDPRRWSRPRRNLRAIDLVRELDLFSCLNILAFDPDTTLSSLTANLEFMRQACDFPFRVGRVAPSAPDIERVFQLVAALFRERDQLAGRVMATRFDLEICRHFDPATHERSWRAEGIALTRVLGEDSVRVLRRIVEHVEHHPASSRDGLLVGGLARGMREVEAQISVALAALAGHVARASGRRRPPTFLGDRASTAPVSP